MNYIGRTDNSFTLHPQNDVESAFMRRFIGQVIHVKTVGRHFTFEVEDAKPKPEPKEEPAKATPKAKPRSAKVDK